MSSPNRVRTDSLLVVGVQRESHRKRWFSLVNLKSRDEKHLEQKKKTEKNVRVMFEKHFYSNLYYPNEDLH